jgi:AraC-like DNA-binding protein
MNTLVWIGFCQSLFAAILMFTKRNNAMSDRILSGWLMLLAIDFLSCGINSKIFVQPLLISSFLLFNPALYLYVGSLTRHRFKLHWAQLLHLIPYLFFGTYTYIIQEPFQLNSFFQHDNHFTFRIIFGAVNLISWLVYNPLTLILVHKFRMNLRTELSNIEKNENLGWVLVVAVFYVVYCLLAFIITVVVFFDKLDPLSPHFYNYSMLLVLIYIMSFYGLRQRQVSKHLLIAGTKTPYLNSNLSPENKYLIRQKIVDYFEKEKAYLNPDLNMNLLSKSLGIPKYQITEVLNTDIGKSFFNFVNFYRVEAVKLMLSDSSNKFSIEAIGYDCGFSSKSSFYTVFKSMTGKTPVSYRESVSR